MPEYCNWKIWSFLPMGFGSGWIWLVIGTVGVGLVSYGLRRKQNAVVWTGILALVVAVLNFVALPVLLSGCIIY